MSKTGSVNQGRTDNTMTQRKSTNNDLQNNCYETKARETRTQLRTRSELSWSGRV